MISQVARKRANKDLIIALLVIAVGIVTMVISYLTKDIWTPLIMNKFSVVQYKEAGSLLYRTYYINLIYAIGIVVGQVIMAIGIYRLILTPYIVLDCYELKTWKRIMIFVINFTILMFLGQIVMLESILPFSIFGLVIIVIVLFIGTYINIGSTSFLGLMGFGFFSMSIIMSEEGFNTNVTNTYRH